MVRGLTTATVATFVALLSHVAAGGAVPGWLGIAVPWVLAAMVCTVLAGRSLSLSRMSIAVLLSQWIFHNLFVLGMVTPSAVTVGHVHGGAASIALSTGAVSAAPLDLAMWIDHGIAAALTILLIHRGEAAVWRLLAIAGEYVVALGRRLTRSAVVWIPVARPTLPIVQGPRALPGLGYFLAVSARRGPPARFV